MGEAKIKHWRGQNTALLFFFAAGVFLAQTPVLAPIHETGHVYYAKISGRDAKITGWATTEIYGGATPGILMNGYYTEVSWALIIFFALFFLSSPSSIGWRRVYAHLGLPTGYAVSAWLGPIVFGVTDFSSVPQWQGAMTASFLLDPGWAVALALLVLWFFRIRHRKA